MTASNESTNTVSHSDEVCAPLSELKTIFKFLVVSISIVGIVLLYGLASLLYNARDEIMSEQVTKKLNSYDFSLILE